MVREKKRNRPATSHRRLWLALLGLACVALLAGGAWWFFANRSAESVTHLDLGRPTGGVRPDGLNLLVITLDTTRADRTGPYGYQGVETPTLDRLARDGVLFEHTMAAAPLTCPAHCSIFTGKFPPDHGVRDNGGFFLSPKQLTLATLLKRRGFQTGAVVAAFVLDRKWGIGEGFDTYVDKFDVAESRGTHVGVIRRPGNEVVDLALPWLEKVKGQRFFAWLHFYDPHAPYEPPEPFKTRYSEHPYLGAIAFMDSQLARVIDFLERNGLMEKTVIAVIGDHGESLGQHGEESHAFFVYEATTRVPFIIRAPFERLRGRRVADPVRSVDLMPTVLDLMGIPAPGGIQGVSLAPLMTGARSTMDLEGYAEALYPLHHFGWSETRAWRVGRYKAIDAPRPEFYDLSRDPHETTNLYAERRTVADGMIARLREIERDAPRDDSVAKAAPEVDPETRARLAALGYVGSFVATVSGPRTDRADPKDKIRLFNLMSDAREIAQIDRQSDASAEKAIALYKQVLADDPNVIDAWFNLGNLHSRLRRFPEAIEYFKRALALKPDYDLPVINMANAYRQMGDDKAALAGYEHYLTFDPTNAHVRYQIGEIYLDRGDEARAVQDFNEALKIDPREASALNALGVIAFQHGDAATAERYARQAIEIKKDVRLAHYNLALIAESRKDLPGAETEYKKELELHPNAFRAAFNLAMLYDQQGNRTAQVDALKQAIEQNPYFPEGKLFLAKAYLDAGINLPEAIGLARESLSLKLRPELTPLAHFVLADLYNRVGRPDEASREVALGRRGK
jgi:arylsulfatase A-like enzyme/tetratricopeptide (TPR) repeat protein